jgi:acid phosphatase
VSADGTTGGDPSERRAAGRRIFLGTASAALAAALVPAHWSQIPPVRDGALRFAVIGDWGTGGMPAQRRTAKALARSARAVKPDFIISTGDNFYPRGVASDKDPHWQASFERVYADRALQCRWYVALGNHDHQGSIAAQIAYTQTDPRWRMPARYYRTSHKLPGDAVAEFFFLDTTTITGSSVVIPGDAAQLDWLEAKLRASRARWKIAIGHHPLYSGGMHGGSQLLRDAVEPLFLRYGVSAYINGHDHDLQHILANGIHYLTSGAGAHVRPVTAIEGTEFAQARLGFMTASITAEAMGIGFVSHSGRTLHRAEFPPRA